MKRLILFIVMVIMVAGTCFAQQLKVVKELSKDMSSTDAVNSKYVKYDYNKKPCGLIRLGLLDPEATFEGNIVYKEYMYDKSEWWIYMTGEISDYLVIYAKGCLPFTYNFKTAIESGATYFMLIEKPMGQAVEDMQTENFLVIRCTTPADAKIFINDEYVGKGEVSKYLSVYKEHTYRVEAPLYHTETGTVRLSAENTTEKNITLKPAFGYLQINTTPQGATIEINRESYSELTPFTTSKLPSGVYTIQAFKEMYKQVTAQAVVEDGKTTRVNINLIPNFGEVNLTSADSDTRIYVDNDYKALGRWGGMLSIGTHKIEAKKDKHTTYSKTIDVQQGQTITETIPALQPICGKLKITSSPLGATINIDGKDYGTTPKVIQELLIGSHTVTLSKAGYTSATKQINIEEGKMAECDMILQEGNVVKIQTDKYGDKLYVDGGYIGTSPMETRLTFGRHKVEAERAGKRVSKQINVTEGSTQSVTLVFIESRSFTVKGVSFTMIAVEGGSYTMGCTSEQGSDCYSSEEPAHSEYVSDFMIGETEVTQALWQAVMGSNPSRFTGDMQRPVDKVSWDACQTFIRKLNQLTGENFRLPTEAEWEYAARGGNKSKKYKYSGSNSVDNVAWYDGNSGNTTHRVKTKQPNELGIYDMSGNVWEWCQDRWSSDYNSPRNGVGRVLRGGSWYYLAWNVRVSCRYDIDPDYRGDGNGLRLALTENSRQNTTSTSVKSSKNGYEYVDLGLSVKWATCNVGANASHEYGNYYAWGEISTKSVYNKNNSYSMGDISGNASYDAARANWGGTWRMPTKREMEELKNKCTWKWTTQSGVKGYKVIGPNGNSIFLPTAGFYDGAVGKNGERCYYWSSTSCGMNSYSLYVFNGSRDMSCCNRYYRYTVRPVFEDTSELKFNTKYNNKSVTKGEDNNPITNSFKESKSVMNSKKEGWLFEEQEGYRRNFLDIGLASNDEEYLSYRLSYSYIKSHLGFYTTIGYSDDDTYTALVGPVLRLTSSEKHNRDFHIYVGGGMASNEIAFDYGIRYSFGKSWFDGEVFKKNPFQFSIGHTITPNFMTFNIGVNIRLAATVTGIVILVNSASSEQ